MEKLKTFAFLALALISVFLLGAYTDATLHGTRVIESHQWGLTSFFGLMFFVAFLKRHKGE